MKKTIKKLLITLVIATYMFTFFVACGDEKPQIESLNVSISLTALAKESNVRTATFVVPNKSAIEVVACKNAYSKSVIEPTKVTKGGESVTYEYTLNQLNEGSNVPNNYVYSITNSEKIMRSGQISLNIKDAYFYNFNYGAIENPQTCLPYEGDRKTTVDNTIVSVGGHNYKSMAVGETFVAKAYRNTQISSGFIEPQFQYKLVSGDSVEITSKGGQANIKAIKNGASVIEVSYNAVIAINGLEEKFYNASAPKQNATFVVNVGGDNATPIELNINKPDDLLYETAPKYPEFETENLGKIDWDSEFDTVYFTGENGNFSFAPSASSAITVKSNNVVVAGENGVYNAPLNDGNNVIEVSAGNTKEFFVVRGKKVTTKIENVTNEGQPIVAGNTVRITIEGLSTPIPTMASLYNAGYNTQASSLYIKGENGNIRVKYLANGVAVQSKGEQYDFPISNSIEYVATASGEVKLTAGKINLGYMGASLGAHRLINDDGIIPTLKDYPNIVTSFCILPEITFTVA